MFANKSKKFLPYGRQFLARPEYRAVRRVLKGPLLTQGPAVERFEQALTIVTGAPYAVAVANGTAALDLAVRAVKIQRSLQSGALALTTPNTFVASSNALLYNQLEPLFCDISCETYNWDMKKVERILKHRNLQEEREDQGGPQSDREEVPKEIPKEPVELLLPVHFAGEPVDMQQLWQLAEKYGLPARGQADSETGSGTPVHRRLAIIEDAAHALGSYYSSYYGETAQPGQVAEQPPVGSCIYSDACCFSFHPVKAVTTAEGGAITCRDPELYEILSLLRSHGINRNPQQWLNAEDNCESRDLVKIDEDEPPLWYYEMQALGHNARLSDVHAALGTEQLRRLPNFARRRRELARRYSRAFEGLSWLRTPLIGPTTCPHLYVVQIDFGYLRIGRNAAMRELRAQNIGTQVHYIPVPMQPFYRNLGYDMEGLGNTEVYYSEALSLPLYPGLKLWEQDQIIRAIYRLAELGW